MNNLEFYTTRLPADMKQKLKVQAVLEKTTAQALLQEALKDLFKKREEGK